MFNAETWINLLYMFPSILIALSFHEYCHGLVSTLLGDDTPRLQGRLSLNPLRHLDPWGTIFMLLTSIGGAGFGWAKPVMVNPNRYKCSRKVGMFLTALAGPLGNVFLALLGGYCCRFIASGLIPYNEYFYLFFYFFVLVNVSLAAFNILPIPPLDGSKVLAIILPSKYANMIYSASQYFIIILLLLSFTGLLGRLMNPIINGLITFINFAINLF